MAAPIAIGMLFQTLYFLIDLYFVARLGDAAIAGVGAAGNAMFVVMALTQVLGVGTMALVSQAVGRKDPADANLVFNQALSLALVFTVATLVGGYLLRRRVHADRRRGRGRRSRPASTYLAWFLPGLALQFVFTVMISGLRGTGVVKPTMVVQIVTVLLNALLAPVLIAGWLTGEPLGVAGAGLASTIAVAAGSLLLALYFRRLEKYIRIRPATWRPQCRVWNRILNIGLPAGGEFGLMFVFMAVIYWVIRDFGAEAQAGFGLGMRLMQSIFLPAMAIAFATAPVAGQNTARSSRTACARRSRAVKISIDPDARADAALPVAAGMAGAWLHAGSRPWSRSRGLPAGSISFNFVASGLIFTCSGMFQALGNTWPALGRDRDRAWSRSCCRRSGCRRSRVTQIDQVWYVSVASVGLQAAISVCCCGGRCGRGFRLGRFSPLPVVTGNCRRGWLCRPGRCSACREHVRVAPDLVAETERKRWLTFTSMPNWFCMKVLVEPLSIRYRLKTRVVSVRRCSKVDRAAQDRLPRSRRRGATRLRRMPTPILPSSFVAGRHDEVIAITDGTRGLVRVVGEASFS